MSITREPGDLQLALPGMVPGEHSGEGESPKPASQGLEESDEVVVPKKPGNLVRSQGAGGGKDLGRGEHDNDHPFRAQDRRYGGQSGLRRVGERTRKEALKSRNDREKLVNLFTHLRVDLLREVFLRLRKKAAPGVDGQTWAEYAEGLDGRLKDLQDRLHRGSYRAPPVRRTHIPKADGTKRPLGIPTIEDKVVQGAVLALLTPIYEVEFLDCSYGFRPGRNQHDALEAVARMLYRGKTSWVLDADIRSFFDTIDHDWMMRMLGDRIGDRRLLRLIRKWLKAGVLADGVLEASKEGTPQGGKISPLLANVYLHYVLDLWVRKEAKGMRGEVHLVRYADDFLIGVQLRDEAAELHRKVGERLRVFGLELHPEKTRRVRFGRFARRDSPRLDGRKKPETFDFLGFTHICGVSRRGGFAVLRRTSRKKRVGKLKELRVEMRRRMHWKVRDQWRWLCSVLRGHYNYYGLPTNVRALKSFRYQVWLSWRKTLQRRSQKASLTRAKLELHDRRYPLPTPRIRAQQPLRPLSPSI